MTIMKCSLLSIDLAKNIFQLCALDAQHNVLFNKKVKRSNLIHELRQIEPTFVVMEACYSANPWGRRIEKLGHNVKSIPPFLVKPFLIGNKNDANDALAEASLRPKVRFIGIKTIEQQDIQSLQRIRELFVKQRTSTLNQARGLLAEYGEVCDKSPIKLMRAIPSILEHPDNELTSITRAFTSRLYEHITHLNQQIDEVDTQLNALVSTKADYKRLISIPGIGPIIAATVLASVPDIHSFKNGRQFAAWIGLTPSQHASGDTNRLGKITKRGNNALRKLLIQGARTVLNWCEGKEDNQSKWLQKLKERLHSCKSAVAFANKLARTIWAVLSSKTMFDASKSCSGQKTA